jgi:hypothetical protein
MGIFGGNHGTTELFLDIGSGKVSAALVYFPDPKEKNKKPTVLVFATNKIPVTEDVSFEIFFSGMKKALEASLVEVLKQKKHPPKQVRCFLASPWYVSKTRSLIYQKNSDFLITDKLIKELVEKEVEDCTTEELKRYRDAGDDARIIEKRTTSVLLNGYKIENPIGKKARSLEMTIFLSISPEMILNTIENIIKRHMSPRSVHFHPFILSAFAVAREVILSVSDFIMIDVGGEVTDMLLIREGNVFGTVSFPFGNHFLYRRIASDFGISIEEARTLFSLYIDNTLEEERKTKLEKVLNSAHTGWMEAFQGALSKINKERVVPETIILIAPGIFGSWIREAIQAEDFHRYTLSDATFKIYTLDESMVSHHVSVLGDTHRDPFAMIESMYVDKVK